MRGACVLALVSPLLWEASTRGASDAADRCLYVPPALGDRVLFYNSFAGGAGAPEIDSLGGRLAARSATPGEGFAGRGLDFRGGGFSLTGISRPLHLPITVSMWWRVRAPMTTESSFHLVTLAGEGYISNFVRSGPWCALTEPTFAVQVWNWPGITNINGIRFGNGWVEADSWHHVALVVSAASTVSVYWDGALRSKVRVEGRTFRPADTITSLRLGPEGRGALPMGIDEVLVLDLPLDAAAVRAYVTSVRQLAGAGFPEVLPGKEKLPPEDR